MSEAHTEDHSTPIKTPQQLLVVVLLAFLVPIGLIVAITQFITSGIRVDPKTHSMSGDEVTARIKPVGSVAIGEPPPPPPPSANAPAAAAPVALGKKADGATVYQNVCSACHGAGVLNSPKFGDKAAWKPRIAQGAATLHEHAIKGIRTMPAKGGNAALSDDEVAAAVDYMVAKAK